MVMYFRENTVMMFHSVCRLLRLLDRERNVLRCRKLLSSVSQRVTRADKPSDDKQKRLPDGPPLEHFIANTNTPSRVSGVKTEPLPYLQREDLLGHGKKGNYWFFLLG